MERLEILMASIRDLLDPDVLTGLGVPSAEACSTDVLPGPRPAPPRFPATKHRARCECGRLAVFEAVGGFVRHRREADGKVCSRSGAAPYVRSLDVPGATVWARSKPAAARDFGAAGRQVAQCICGVEVVADSERGYVAHEGAVRGRPCPAVGTIPAVADLVAPPVTTHGAGSGHRHVAPGVSKATVRQPQGERTKARKVTPLTSAGPMPPVSKASKVTSWVNRVADLHVQRMRQLHGPRTSVVIDEPFATAMWALWEQGLARNVAQGLARALRGFHQGARPLEAEVKYSVLQVARLARNGHVTKDDRARFSAALTALVVHEVEAADRKAEEKRVRKAQPRPVVRARQQERLLSLAAAQGRRRETERLRSEPVAPPVARPLTKAQVKDWKLAEAEARARSAARRARDEEAERLRETARESAAEEFRARNPRPISRKY